MFGHCVLLDCRVAHFKRWDDRGSMGARTAIESICANQPQEPQSHQRSDSDTSRRGFLAESSQLLATYGLMALFGLWHRSIG